jgi:hypothetical protein
MGLISDTLLIHLPGKRKTTPSGWISFNAPCCADKRQRGGFIINAGDGVSYHCFNCGFKASWQPGRTVSQKMRKLMRLLHVSDDQISKMALEALRLNEDQQAQPQALIPKFDVRALPMDSLSMVEWAENIAQSDFSMPENFKKCIEYLVDRNIDPKSYPFYWTPKVGFSNRVIIPFLYKGEIVGWTARAINDAKPKYLSEQQPGYVFNLDKQQSPPWEHDDGEIVIVSEGPFDALSIDGCALLGAEIKEQQNMLLHQIGKEIVLVPDRDHEGPRTVEQAIEYGWSVSMPDWPDDVKDINDAVVKLGKLATMWLIVSAKEKNSLKIQLRAKKWFKEIYAEHN